LFLDVELARNAKAPSMERKIISRRDVIGGEEIIYEDINGFRTTDSPYFRSLAWLGSLRDIEDIPLEETVGFPPSRFDARYKILD
jgi:hypothetical protein